LRRPDDIPEDIFIEELVFYEIDEHIIQEFKDKEGLLVDEKV